MNLLRRMLALYRVWDRSASISGATRGYLVIMARASVAFAIFMLAVRQWALGAIVGVFAILAVRRLRK